MFNVRYLGRGNFLNILKDITERAPLTSLKRRESTFDVNNLIWKAKLKLASWE